MITINTYFKKKHSWVVEHFPHEVYDDNFHLRNATDCFVHIDEMENEENINFFKHQICKYSQTAIIITYKDEILLNFTSYDPNQWYSLLVALGEAWRTGEGHGFTYDRQLHFRMKTLGNNQMKLQFDYDEDHIVSSTILPENELTTAILTEAKKYYSTLIRFDVDLSKELASINRILGIDLFESLI
ncbi:hypothetical protein I6N90_01730 [Paenibacillus sp. GSMTC-2017]|uniref:hypothetical protein n=1 Tax=Paenibacillus sp. GSMTC-2017 TaxID=2794350 RepID=UPI0018D9DD4B|nr:hypothetical protein [Paenibacillus sp. GSMTC-2017]MBH5316524.1 hypothetical protein [Paenibacillus sp. GSMTC-2017]